MADSYQLIGDQVIPYYGGRKSHCTGEWRDATPLELQLQEQLCAAERALEAATEELEELRTLKWLPIESAPIVKSMLAATPRCLVYSKEFGIQMGSAWRYPDGDARGQGDGFNGEWNVTHWMPLPAPPEDE